MPLRSGVTSKHPPNPHRDAVMISHAFEDNIFTRWLALQLARNGYRVWCDLTKLLGGEIFWRDIERALRFRAAKLSTFSRAPLTPAKDEDFGRNWI
jgi:hypothetical protein